MKILILGGHGFVGKSLVEGFMNAEHEIFGLSREDGLDLTNESLAKDYFQKIIPDIVYNCACHGGSLHYVTTYAADVIDDNVQMALNMYRAVKEVCPNATVINPLSNCSYPGDANIHYEPNWLNGEVHDSVFSYANAKRFVYAISKSYHKQYGIRSLNFLIPNAFGPGDHADPNRTHALNGMIIRMIKAGRQGDGEFEVWGTGSPIREWGYIRDIVNLLIKGLAVENDLIYPVNMAQNKGYSIKASAELIREAIGFEGRLVFNRKYQDGAPFKILDDKKFRSIFPGYEFYDHKRGIQETVEYYESVL